jgi:hypothetical protein
VSASGRYARARRCSSLGTLLGVAEVAALLEEVPCCVDSLHTLGVAADIWVVDLRERLDRGIDQDPRRAGREAEISPCVGDRVSGWRRRRRRTPPSRSGSASASSARIGTHFDLSVVAKMIAAPQDWQ